MWKSIIVMAVAIGSLILSSVFSSANILPSKKDLTFLKKLLLYRMSSNTAYPTTFPTGVTAADWTTTMSSTSVTSGTLSTSVTTTELSIMVARTNGTPLMDEFYNTIWTGNGTLQTKMQSLFLEAAPHLRTLNANTTDRLSKQRALVELAVKVQPLLPMMRASNGNLTDKVAALGEFLSANRTARDGGGYGGGSGGWGWGGGGGGGCCCCKSGGWGGGGGGGGGGGWGNNYLEYYLLSQNNKGGNSDLNTLLPVRQISTWILTMRRM
ncbi:hypothetical protein RvY_17982 [Ramazzottius varieornatus]|uniref:Uncharacterized protein n=1 Tax=Ramazzottius varieornatus TaxID=947166 RepID=A0A1D1W600_RAMVA|nr:hypothetical protein RvY_17982 [Ramazzottius varieornatus]